MGFPGRQKIALKPIFGKAYKKYSVTSLSEGKSAKVKNGILSANDKNYSYKVRVLAYVRSGKKWIVDKYVDITFDKPYFVPSKLEIGKDETGKKVPIIYSYGTPSYKSSNPKVVKVNSQTGELIPVKPGTATITVSFGKGKNAGKYTIKVTVTPANG